MKNFKLQIAILLIVVVMLGCVGGVVNNAVAEGTQEGYTGLDGKFEAFVVSGAVRMYSYAYFGASGIATTIDIYTDDRDFSTGSKLTTTMETIHAFMMNVSNSIDTQIETSDIYRYNHTSVATESDKGQKIEISKVTYEILTTAQEMYESTNHNFNPAVYRLVDLWGFSSRIYNYANYNEPYDREWTKDSTGRYYYPLPNDKYIDAFRQTSFTDFSSSAVTLSTSEDKYYITKNVVDVKVDDSSFSQWIDLGGVAKGYCADNIANILEENNYNDYFVDVGTSSQVYGSSGDNSRVLGLQDPNSIFYCYCGVTISDNAISTSGQYIRNYTVDGVEYAHIIDGIEGRPAQTGIKSITVIAPIGSKWATMGDALTTAFTVMGRDGIVDFFNSTAKEEGLKIFVIYERIDGKMQILSNVSTDDISVEELSTFENYGWAIEQNDDGEFVYNYNAVAEDETQEDNTVLIVAVIAGVFVVGLIVFATIRKVTPQDKLVATKNGKLFRPGDVVVYLALLLVIVMLFGAFFKEDKANLSVITVQDMATGKTLFTYNVARKETVACEVDGWTIDVDKSQSDKIVVTFTKTFDGEERYNKMEINLGTTTSVKMVESICGLHQDCIYNFPEISSAGGTIVCSPNRLKIVTE